jgi:hypothetical protein
MDSLLKALLTVHYFLIATVLVAIVGSQTFTTTQLQKAREDIASLKVWTEATWDVAPFQSPSPELLHRVHALSDTDYAPFQMADRFLEFSWDNKIRCVPIVRSYIWAVEPDRSAYEIQPDLVTLPDTLRAAQWNWERLHDVFLIEPTDFGNTIEIRSTNIVVYLGPGATDKVERRTLTSSPTMVEVCSGTPFARAQSSLNPPKAELAASFAKHYSNGSREGVADLSLYIERIDDLGDIDIAGKPTTIVVVPMRVKTRRLDVQEMLLESRQSHHAPGAFSSTFPELAKVTEGLGKLPLADVAIFVEALGKQVGDKVQIAQIDIPARSFGGWTTIILLSLQSLLYMLVQRGREGPSAADLLSSPWFPLFDGHFAEWATFLTVLILPPVSTLLALTSTLDLASRFLQDGIIVASFMASLTLAIVTYRSIGPLRSAAIAALTSS